MREISPFELNIIVRHERPREGSTTHFCLVSFVRPLRLITVFLVGLWTKRAGQLCVDIVVLQAEIEVIAGMQNILPVKNEVVHLRIRVLSKPVATLPVRS